ncbi:restriction endonuclease subunit S [Sedimentibacter sp. zth1]|nr:restriction endonuclease subunit S [Sedimentibacter sp. zth1]
MLRVKLTQRQLQSSAKDIKDKEKLFQFMKKVTEDELGFFPADRDDFIVIYETLKGVDLIEFALKIFKDDKMGTIVSPSYLTEFIRDTALGVNPKKILITEAEKHLAALGRFIDTFADSQITLTTQSKPMYLLLQLAFGYENNIKIIFESIYTQCLSGEKYDYIYSIPTFGYKPDNFKHKFFTRDSEGIAVENLLKHLEEDGYLNIIIPAKITFSGMGYERLRKFITEYYCLKNIFILPEGTFRPATSIKTYLFVITKALHDKIEVGTLNLDKERFYVDVKKQIDMKEFIIHEDWRVELLLSDDDANIKKFKNSSLEKIKIKEIAEVFRGKSILKKDTSVGNVSVLNISNIEDGEINYLDMDTIDEEERKIKRYELLNNDVVLSCRGTAIKSAVFKEQDKLVIASANVIVIRPKEKVLGEYIKIFFESPIGMAIIKSFQRGTTVMNINHSDIMEMEITLLTLREQENMVKRYAEESSIYKEAVNIAKKRWSSTKINLYNQLT